MTTIRDVYRDAVENYLDDGWYANWPLTETLSLGETCRAHGNRISYERQPTALAEADTRRTAAQNWQYQSEDDVKIDLEAGVTSPLGPQAKLTATFGRTGGLHLSAVGVTTERVADLDHARQTLLGASAVDRPIKGTAVVVERLVAGRVLLLACVGHGATFEATATGDCASISIPAELAGRLSFVSSSSAVAFEQYNEPVVLAARLVVLGTRGWFWWRHTVVRGVSAISESQTLAMMEAADDYFAKFAPAAEPGAGPAV